MGYVNMCGLTDVLRNMKIGILVFACLVLPQLGILKADLVLYEVKAGASLELWALVAQTCFL